jgi:hypothetical protein
VTNLPSDQIVAFGTLLLAAFTAASIVVAVVLYRRQCNVQVFLEYTKRYADIMNMFPSEGRKARLDLFGDPPPESDELSLSVLRYLNLCSEEFYLCKKKYLSSHVWRIWEAELKRTLGSTLVVREWARLREEFQAYPEFLEYVECAQRRSCAADFNVAPQLTEKGSQFTPNQASLREHSSR